MRQAFFLYTNHAGIHGPGRLLGIIHQTSRGFRFQPLPFSGRRRRVVKTFERAIPRPYTIDNTRSELMEPYR